MLKLESLSTLSTLKGMGMWVVNYRNIKGINHLHRCGWVALLHSNIEKR